MTKKLENSREVSMNLGRAIRFYREKQGLSLAQLANKAKISSSYLNRLELGERLAPSLPVIGNIANALGIPVEHLIVMAIPTDTVIFTEKSGILTFTELLFENDFTILDKPVKQEEKEGIIMLIETIFDFNWSGNEKNEELYELLIMVDSLKEVI